MKDTYHLIQATEKHVHLLTTLGTLTFYESYSIYNSFEDLLSYTYKSFHENQILNEIKSQETIFYIIFDMNIPIAYIKINTKSPPELDFKKNSLELQRIYVLAPYQKKGVGKILLDKAIDIAKEKLCEIIWLGVWKENHKALSFYYKNNFVKLGDRNFQVGEKKYEDDILGLTISK